MPIYKQKEKNKDGVYKYRVRINYTDNFGKAKQLTRVVFGLREAKQLEAELMNNLPTETSNKSITLDKLHDEYIEHMKYEIRESTVSKKEQVYKYHIKDVLGKKKLTQLNTKVLTLWKNSENEKEQSNITKQNAFAELRATLNYAVKLDYLPSNPILKIDNFRNAYAERKEINFYTPEEFIKFKDAALEEAERTGYYDYYVFFALAYYTGARKGEIHALRWNCFDGEFIDIHASIGQKIKPGEDVETPPKNTSSNRIIQAPAPLIQILEEHKQRQQSLISDWSEDNFICGYYKSLRDTNIEKENQKYANTANIKHIRIHDFRHSHASLLINNGINALEVARRLGHSTVDQTLKTYAHLFPKENEKAMNVLNNI